MSADHYDISVGVWKDERRGEYRTINVNAGQSWTEEIGPPEFRREVTRWPHNIQISVSPTGRSVQVYINGEKVA